MTTAAMTVANDNAQNGHHGAHFTDPEEEPCSTFHWLPAPPGLPRQQTLPASIIPVVAVAAAIGAIDMANPNFKPVYVPLDLYDRIEHIRRQIIGV